MSNSISEVQFLFQKSNSFPSSISETTPTSFPPYLFILEVISIPLLKKLLCTSIETSQQTVNLTFAYKESVSLVRQKTSLPSFFDILQMPFLLQLTVWLKNRFFFFLEELEGIFFSVIYALVAVTQ